MSTEQLDGEPLASWDEGEGDLTSIALVTATGEGLYVGDTITFSGVRVDPWWKRALRWLRILPPLSKRPLQQFVVTWIGDDEP